MIPGLIEGGLNELRMKGKQKDERTYNPEGSENVTSVMWERQEREWWRTRRMLINRSAPHPLSRKTPRGGRMMAKLAKSEARS
jgi:hypothetical protein